MAQRNQGFNRNAPVVPPM